jgi:hypothetical protein
VVGYSERGNELSGFTKGGVLLDQMSDNQFLTKSQLLVCNVCTILVSEPPVNSLTIQCKSSSVQFRGLSVFLYCKCYRACYSSTRRLPASVTGGVGQ